MALDAIDEDVNAGLLTHAEADAARDRGKLEMGRIGMPDIALNVNVTLDGCIEVECENLDEPLVDNDVRKLSRQESIAIANELVICVCGHSVASHLNDERSCKCCGCPRFQLAVDVAKDDV
jgi:hypothetical protein